MGRVSWHSIRSRTPLANIAEPSLAALIAVQTFNVKITKLPFAGIEIELVDQLIPVALTLSLVYLTISFIVCLTDDIVNFGGATFVEERVKQSREGYKSGEELFAKYILDLLRRYLDKDPAEYIAKELGRLLFIAGPQAEDDIANYADNMLQRHKDNLVLKETI